jgi:hypothetical protein
MSRSGFSGETEVETMVMTCLYASDYGPAEPGFDPLGDGGMLIKGFETAAPSLAGARNLGQLQAMERVLARGDTVRWCDQGYGWAEGMQFHALFAAVLIVAMPYLAWRLRSRRAARRSASFPVSSTNGARHAVEPEIN